MSWDALILAMFGDSYKSIEAFDCNIRACLNSMTVQLVGQHYIYVLNTNTVFCVDHYLHFGSM